MNVLLVYRAKTFKTEILPRLAEFKGHSITLIVHQEQEKIFVKWLDSNKYIQEIYSADEFFEGKLNDMKFDVIVGNPPYQNYKSDSNAGKLYIDISRKLVDYLTQNGVMSFITPTTLAQEKKTGFTLKGIRGLKEIDYTTNNYFDVNVEVMSWLIDKSYIGPVKVIENDNTSLREIGEMLVKENDIAAFRLFEKIKNGSDKLFTIDQTTGGNAKQKCKTDEYKYEIYTNYFKSKIEYTRVKPQLYKKLKMVISMGKTYGEENCVITNDDVGQYHCVLDVEDYTEAQILNLKSFLFSDITLKICSKYRKLYKTGINAILYSFPKIEKDMMYSENYVVKLFNLTQEEIDFLK